MLSFVVTVSIFLMVFLPLVRFINSICAGIDRINKPVVRSIPEPGRAIGYHNKLGDN